MRFMSAEAPIRERLGHVYWIGGGSGAGKSTIARALAAEHGFNVYATDDVMADHAERSAPEATPLLRDFLAMDMDERWVNRSPITMLQTFHWFRGEAFDLIVEDLLERPSDRPPVIAEGFRLLPSLVKPLLATPEQAVWLLPTPEFRRRTFESRRPWGAPWTFINQTSDPETALANLLERDRMFTEQLSADADRLGLPVIEIGNDTTESAAVRLVRAALAV
jgi:2-phosphoglycerate kinase